MNWLRLINVIKRAHILPLNLYRDIRYGGKHLGIYDPESYDADLEYQIVENSPYESLSRIFNKVGVHDDDVLADIGCGPGRVLNFWLSRSRRARIVGLERDPEMARATAERLKKYDNVEIIIGDAIDNLPPETTVIFLYNPFNEHHTRRLAEKAITLKNRKRLRVAYTMCVYLHVFEEQGCWEIEHGDYRRQPWAILRYTGE